MTSCICEKHKDELKKLSVEQLESKLTDCGIKLFSLKQMYQAELQIMDLLIAERESRCNGD